MLQALQRLLQHSRRWRSIAILTDIYEPMVAALMLLTDPLNNGAPKLESLTLMRCNEFACFRPDFQPSHLKDVSAYIVPFGGSPPSGRTLPSLRKLNLTGVHVEWLGIPRVSHPTASDPAGGLQTLQLSYHCPEVRPTAKQFLGILNGSPNLRRLIVNTSGPYIFDRPEEEAHVVDAELDYLESHLVTLERLEEIYYGYTSAYDVCKVLKAINAPNVQRLRLEDTTYLAALHEDNGGYLLTYLAGGTQIEEDEAEEADPPEDEYSDEFDTQKFPCGDAKLSQVCDDPVIRLLEPVSLPFPHLRDVRLTRIKACPGQFKVFFHQLPYLERLELSFVPQFVLRTLMPRAGVTPCLNLTTLHVRDDEVDVAFIVGSLWSLRTMWGACEFEDVEVEVRQAVAGQSIDFPNPKKRAVRVIYKPLDEHVCDLDGDCFVEEDWLDDEEAAEGRNLLAS
jgi:hypothetical protein